MRPTLRLVLLSLISVACVALGERSATAQANNSACIERYMAALNDNGISRGIAPDEVQQVLDDVKSANNVYLDITLVPCEFAIQASAQVVKSGRMPPPGQYIIYNEVWVRQVIGDNRLQAAALFGHELGHIINQDFFAGDERSQLEMESKADKFAGCAVSSLGGDWSSVEGLLSRIRSDHSNGNYPDKVESLRQAKIGFENCRARARSPTILPVDGGQFNFGRSPNDKKAENWERRDQQPVVVGSYGLAVTETTVAQWLACETCKRPRNVDPNLDGPITDVSWNDVQEYIRWLNAHSGRGGYRLPTEVEWEYAARAGTTVARPVQNAWGFSTMLGGVWEYTQDCFDYNLDKYPSNGKPYGSPSCENISVRGGDTRPDTQRVSARQPFAKNKTSNSIGFRVARDLE
jgi:hypothetical protein